MTDQEFKEAALKCKDDDEVWALAERQAEERTGHPGPVLAWVHEADRIRREARGDESEREAEIDYDATGPRAACRS